MKKINTRTFILFLLIFALLGNSVQAASQSIVKEVTYDTMNSNEKRTFDEKIKENGKTYKLKEVTYEVVNSEAETENKKVFLKKKVSSKKLPANEITKGAISYLLVDTKKEKKTTQKAWNQTVEAFTEFESEQDAQSASNTKSVRVKNAVTGKMEEVICKKRNVSKSSKGWVKTHINILFTRYDADTYMWNGIAVKKREDNPLQGYDEELIKSVGGKPKQYKVESISWNGKSYEKNGVTYRKAKANVLKRVRYYRANYTGSIHHKAKKKTVYVCKYEGNQEIKTDKVKYTILAKAVYEKESKTTVVFVTVFLLLLLIVVVGILFLVARKKKTNKNN